MHNLQRLKLRKYSSAETSILMTRATDSIIRLVSPLRVIAFGSVVNGTFDDASDLDFVVIFDTPEKAASGNRLLYRNGHLEGRRVDFLCVDEQTFLRKSEVGGIYWVAAHEGKVTFPIP